MNFSPKEPDSKEYFGFSYENELASLPGVTITGATWEIVQVGAQNDETDPAPSLMKSGNTVINGANVLQFIIGGVDLVQYCFSCEATLSDGQVLPKSATCWVRTACRRA